MQYQKFQTRNQFTSQIGQTNSSRNGNRQFIIKSEGNGGVVLGEVLSADETSLTVKMQDGNSKIVLLATTTSINKQATGSYTDLKIGEKVAVFGTTNPDGSVTAQNIQLNPTFGPGIRTEAKLTPLPTK